MNIADRSNATEKRDAAYEIKFVVPTALAEAAMAWARRHLAPDPHAEITDADGYRVNSLYFDTSNLDVYRRNGSYGKSKYRVRRYGNESGIFLERKLKSRGLVSKRRTRIPDEELPRLAAEPSPEWVGFWFRRRLEVRQLFPRCQIRYDRVARVGMTPSGPIRLTIDQNVCSFVTSEYGVEDNGGWKWLLPGQCIVELKFRVEMPPLFKSLTEELALAPQPVSKYRLSIQAFGLDPAPSNGQPAAHNGHVNSDDLLAIPQRTAEEAAARPET